MTQTTRCPACATRFKIVPDQLKIGQGWARCGQCGEVFDARLSLQTLSQPEGLASAQAPVPAAVPAPVSAWMPPAPAPAPAPAAVLPEPALVPDPDPLRPLSIDPPAYAQDARLTGEERIAPTFDDLRIDIDSEPGSSPGPLDEPQIKTQIEPQIEPHIEPHIEPRAQSLLDDEEPAPATAQATAPASTVSAGFDPSGDLSFVRRARRRAAWRRPWVRAVLGILALGLSLLLALQAAFHYRDLLASQYPALRPLLAALCEQAQCRLGPPRRIDVITIDGSSFTRLQGDTYRLGVNLTNQSTAAVAMPAIELTLTDAQEQPVLRRVLLPADFGADTPDRIAAGGEWSLSASILVAGAANTQRIAGYRVLAFYP